MASGLSFSEIGKGELTIVFLHYFGGSSVTWQPVAAALSGCYHCIAVDLPGFGSSAAPAEPLSTDEQSEMVISLIKSLNIGRFVLAGHSMGGKIALAIAVRHPPGLKAVVLIAPSPPTPEPTDAMDRHKMAIAWNNATAIKEIIGKITAQPLEKAVLDRCVTDQLRVAHVAWDGWLNKGSREDISSQMSAVDQPLLLITGSKDPNLSTAFLKKVFTKYFHFFCSEELQGGHLLPIEAASAVISVIRRFLSKHIE